MDDFTKIYDQPVEVAFGKPVEAGKMDIMSFSLIQMQLIITDLQ